MFFLQKLPFLGATLMFVFSDLGEFIIQTVFPPITAVFFIYIALSDSIYEIHHECRKGFVLKDTAMLILRIVAIYVVTTALNLLVVH